MTLYPRRKNSPTIFTNIESQRNGECSKIEIKMSWWQCQKVLRSTIWSYHTAVVMQSSIFWEISLCSPLKVNGRFGGTRRLHLQFRRRSQVRSHREADSEQGVGWVSIDYTTLYPGRWDYSYTLLWDPQSCSLCSFFQNISRNTS
jgi:hypothetical protein